MKSKVQFLILTKIDNERDTQRFTFVLAFAEPIFRMILRGDINVGAGELHGILADIDVVQTFDKKQLEA